MWGRTMIETVASKTMSKDLSFGLKDCLTDHETLYQAFDTADTIYSTSAFLFWMLNAKLQVRWMQTIIYMTTHNALAL